MNLNLPFPYITFFIIPSVFGEQADTRGQALAEDGAVELVSCTDLSHSSTAEVLAKVTGTQGDLYTTRLTVEKTGRTVGEMLRQGIDVGPAELSEADLWGPQMSLCTCPVGINCKHGAAVAYETMFSVVEWAASGPTYGEADDAAPNAPAAAVSQWRRFLAPLLRYGKSVEDDGVPEPQLPLALGFELHGDNLAPSSYAWDQVPYTFEHLERRTKPSLSVIPLKRGKRDNWIKGNLSWRSFEFRFGHEGYDPAHAEALTRIFALAESERSHTYGTVERLWFNSFRTPLVWEAFARARDAGVAFVGLGNVASVRLAERAEVTFDLRSPSATLLSAADGVSNPDASNDPGVMQLVPTVHIDGHVRPEALPLGSRGVVTVQVHEGVQGSSSSPQKGRGGKKRQESSKASMFDLVIAPTEHELMKPFQDLLHGTEDIRIPESDREEFFKAVVPRLNRFARVESSDNSVEFPKPPTPLLHLNARYSGKNSLTLRWHWEYPDIGRTYPVFTSAGAHRDHDYEESLLAEVREFWPTVGGAILGGKLDPGTEELNDVDTAAFTTQALPQLEAMEGVKVSVTGTRREYRELEGAPQIKVTQTESPDKNDWFNLGFTVTIDGYEIPFPTLFVALAKGEDSLLLDDGTYFSLDNPAFDVLRNLIREGEALAEWEPHNLQVSKYQVGFFEDIENVADDVEISKAWSETVGKLKGLDSIPNASVPGGLHAELRPYQLEGFHYLAFLHSLGLGGILADDMGLGKTLQALALIQHAFEDSEASEGRRRRPFLVVAPSSVVSVWEQEAARFTPQLKVVTLSQTQKKRRVPVREAIAGADLVITSYTIMRIDAEEFAAEQFSGLILDEAQFVKNRASRVHQCAKRIAAPFRLAITGTPMENSLTDLWSLLALTAPGVLGNAVQFRTEFVQPIESGEHPEKMEVLRRRVRPFMLRRTKELVAKDLPEKQEQTLHVELEPAHRKLYDRVLQRERKKVLGLLNDMDKNRFIVFRSLTLLRMLALDPAIVNDGEYDGVPSSKLAVMLERLDEVVAEGHRVLVFSQFTSFLTRVAHALDERGVPHSYMDGSTRNRAEVIRGFREGGNPVFLISLKAGGFGLTLTEADYVFLLDPWWNPAAENQAIDRAHRIGQSERVLVYRLVAEDTIEDKVLALQEKKRALFDSLTEEGEAFAKSVSAEDVRALFE